MATLLVRSTSEGRAGYYEGARGIKLNTMDVFIVYFKSNKVYVLHRWLAIAYLCIVFVAVSLPGSPASGGVP